MAYLADESYYAPYYDPNYVPPPPDQTQAAPTNYIPGSTYVPPEQAAAAPAPAPAGPNMANDPQAYQAVPAPIPEAAPAPYDYTGGMGGPPSPDVTAAPPPPPAAPVEQAPPAAAPKPEETYLGGTGLAPAAPTVWEPLAAESRNSSGVEGIQAPPTLNQRSVNQPSAYDTPGRGVPALDGGNPHDPGQGITTGFLPGSRETNAQGVGPLGLRGGGEALADFPRAPRPKPAFPNPPQFTPDPEPRGGNTYGPSSDQGYYAQFGESISAAPLPTSLTHRFDEDGSTSTSLIDTGSTGALARGEPGDWWDIKPGRPLPNAEAPYLPNDERQLSTRGEAPPGALSPPSPAVNSGAGSGLGNISRPSPEESHASRNAYAQRQEAGVPEGAHDPNAIPDTLGTTAQRLSTSPSLVPNPPDSGMTDEQWHVLSSLIMGTKGSGSPLSSFSDVTHPLSAPPPRPDMANDPQVYQANPAPPVANTGLNYHPPTPGSSSTTPFPPGTVEQPPPVGVKYHEPVSNTGLNYHPPTPGAPVTTPGDRGTTMPTIAQRERAAYLESQTPEYKDAQARGDVAAKMGSITPAQLEILDNLTAAASLGSGLSSGPVTTLGDAAISLVKGGAKQGLSALGKVVRGEGRMMATEPAPLSLRSAEAAPENIAPPRPPGEPSPQGQYIRKQGTTEPIPQSPVDIGKPPAYSSAEGAVQGTVNSSLGTTSALRRADAEASFPWEQRAVEDTLAGPAGRSQAIRAVDHTTGDVTRYYDDVPPPPQGTLPRPPGEPMPQGQYIKQQGTTKPVPRGGEAPPPPQGVLPEPPPTMGRTISQNPAALYKRAPTTGEAYLRSTMNGRRGTAPTSPNGKLPALPPPSTTAPAYARQTSGRPSLQNGQILGPQPAPSRPSMGAAGVGVRGKTPTAPLPPQPPSTPHTTPVVEAAAPVEAPPLKPGLSLKKGILGVGAAGVADAAITDEVSRRISPVVSGDSDRHPQPLQPTPKAPFRPTDPSDALSSGLGYSPRGGQTTLEAGLASLPGEDVHGASFTPKFIKDNSESYTGDDGITHPPFVNAADGTWTQAAADEGHIDAKFVGKPVSPLHLNKVLAGSPLEPSVREATEADLVGDQGVAPAAEGAPSGDSSTPYVKKPYTPYVKKAYTPYTRSGGGGGSPSYYARGGGGSFHSSGGYTPRGGGSSGGGGGYQGGGGGNVSLPTLPAGRGHASSVLPPDFMESFPDSFGFPDLSAIFAQAFGKSRSSHSPSSSHTSKTTKSRKGKRTRKLGSSHSKGSSSAPTNATIREGVRKKTSA